MKLKTAILALLSLSAAAQLRADEKIILINEGSWQVDNGQITYFENGTVVTNEWFREVNKTKLGDTPSDIIQINDTLLVISVDGADLIQYITPECKAAGVTEFAPAKRKFVSDGKYLYVSTYAHECVTSGGKKEFTKGFVAKVDVATLKILSAVEVGYEPEGIALYKNRLFVANSGGYSFQEQHDYETTVSVINPDDMTVIRTVDTGQPNLYGKIAQSGQYMCISSPGDYYEIPAASVILDCDAVLDGKADSECFIKLDFPATNSATATDGSFYTVGSSYSYITGGFDYFFHTIDPSRLFATGGSEGVSEGLPGTVADDFKAMTAPNALYVNPYTGYIYGADAGDFIDAGYMYQWSPEGSLLGKHKVYINPAHFLALPPDGHFGAVDTVVIPENTDNTYYNLQGIPVATPREGGLYIHNGKKLIYRAAAVR